MKSIYKKLTAGVIIRDPVTRFVLGCLPTGKPKVTFDLPKGRVDPGEFAIDAAVRELFEETGLAIDKIEIRDLGKYSYVKDKDIHLFYTERSIDLKSLKCSSMLISPNTGEVIPEISGYSMIDINDDKWYPALKKVMKEALSTNNLLESI